MCEGGKEQDFFLCDLTFHVFVGFVNDTIVTPSLVIQVHPLFFLYIYLGCYGSPFDQDYVLDT